MEIFSKTQMIQSDLSNYDSEIFTFSQDNAALAFMLFPGAEYDSDLVNKVGLLSKAEHTISVVTQEGFDSFTSCLDISDIGKAANGFFLIQTVSQELIEDIQKWVHFFGPVSGKTKVDSFIGYAAHLGLIRGGTPSGLYC